MSAGVLVLLVFAWRPFRTSCWIVGTGFLRSLSAVMAAGPRRRRLSQSPSRVTPTTFDQGHPCGNPGTRGRACRPVSRSWHTFARVPGIGCDRGAPGARIPSSGARTNRPGTPGHEGKEYRPQARRSKRGRKSCGLMLTDRPCLRGHSDAALFPHQFHVRTVSPLRTHSWRLQSTSVPARSRTDLQHPGPEGQANCSSRTRRNARIVTPSPTAAQLTPAMARPRPLNRSAGGGAARRICR